MDRRLLEGLPPALQDYAAAIAEQARRAFQSAEANPGLAIGLAAAGVVAFGLVLVVLIAVAQVARVGLYRSADLIEGGAPPPGLREGLALGWSMRTLRLLLLEILVGFCMLLLVLPIILVAILPLVLGDGAGGRGAEVLAALAGACLGLLLLVAIAIAVSMIQQLYVCEIAIADRPIGAAFARAVGLLRAHPMSIVLLAVSLFLIAMALTMAFAVIFAVLGLLGLLLAIGIGGLLNGLVGGLLGGYATLITLVVGVLLTTLMLAIPFALALGWLQAFNASAWTVAWRAMTGRDGLSDPPAQALAEPA
jgi:hypothetical protein